LSGKDTTKYLIIKQLMMIPFYRQSIFSFTLVGSTFYH